MTIDEEKVTKNYHKATAAETAAIYAMQKRDAKATMIEFLNDVVPNAPRDVNAMDYLNQIDQVAALVDFVLILKDELLELCRREERLNCTRTADIAAYFAATDPNWFRVACQAGPELKALFDAMPWLYLDYLDWNDFRREDR